MIKDSLTFEYNGIDSSAYKLINVNYNVGLFEEDFLPEQELFAERIPGRDDPYLLGSKTMPLQIDLEFAFTEGFGEDDKYIRDVSRWLFQEYYKPLIFSNAPDKIYYCIYDGEPNLLHNCNKEGLIQITMRNIDPYARSPLYETEMYESVEEIEIDNSGNIEIFPLIELEVLDNIDILLLTNDTNDTVLRFDNLLAGDELEIDLRYQVVDAFNGNKKVFRYDNMARNTFKLAVGANKLFVTPIDKDWKMKFKYQMGW